MEQDNDNTNENIILSTKTDFKKDSNSNLRHKCLDCEFFGFKPKKNNCIITKFVNNHNHQLLADTELFSTEFRSLSDNIKQDINYYVECGIKRDKADTYNDSAKLLENLLAQQQEDPLILVISQINPITLYLTAKTTINLAVEVNDQMHFKKMLTEYYDELIKTKENNQSKRRLQVIENREKKEIISVVNNDDILFSSGDVIYLTDEILELLEHIGKIIKVLVKERGYGCRRCGDIGHNVMNIKKYKNSKLLNSKIKA
ncbi:unnamed protein product [Rhizophagus irregularis]|nr:unnamed protein product [Rhizophagus irregularis]